MKTLLVKIVAILFPPAPGKNLKKLIYEYLVFFGGILISIPQDHIFASLLER